MNSDAKSDTKSIYEWLCCPTCDSRDIIRGPRNERGAVKLECEKCETTGWVAL
jgi:predicted RNA-binding Zn-ribbon protein involved in translation (DUF1610 family)